MIQRLISVTALLLNWTVASAGDPELNVGDAAPPLALKEFVKGEPVQRLEKGKIYVVEFWAIDCPPCRAAIPHLTALQKKYPRVIFIGVNFSKTEVPEDVKPFVAKMGAKMDYRVALDDRAEEAVGANDSVKWLKRTKMAKTWMVPAGRYGIPTSFIVNAEGKIAWIGHPMGLDHADTGKPLEKITAGRWDLAAAAKRYKEERYAKSEREELWKKVREQVAKAEKTGDSRPLVAFIDQAIADHPELAATLRLLKWHGLVRLAKDDSQKVVALIDQAIADDPKLEKRLGMDKFQAMLKQANGTDKAVGYGKRLVEQMGHKDTGRTLYDAVQLYNLALAVVGPHAEAKTKANAQLVQLAQQAALRGEELAKARGDDYLASNIADTLAKAYFIGGDITKAVETQERAIKLAMGTPAAKEPGLRKRLEVYKKAAQKR